MRRFEPYPFRCYNRNRTHECVAILKVIAFLLLLNAAAFAQANTFSFKGIRLGMSVEEFKDSMKTISFLRKPDFIYDYFSESQKEIDTLTHSISYYNANISVGCIEQYGSKSCESMEVLSLEFLKGRLVEIRLNQFDKSYVTNLLNILSSGIEGKLGTPTKDLRSYWEKYDIDNVPRETTYYYSEWTKTEGKDTLAVEITFRKDKSDKDHFNEYNNKFYAAFDVTLLAELKSRELQDWYKRTMSKQVEQHQKDKETPHVKSDF